MLDGVRQDLTHALRAWRRQPGAIAAALVAFALGIGANTTVFSFVSGVLLKPLAYSQPDRLVMVWQDLSARGGRARDWVSPGLYVAWSRQPQLLDAIGAVRNWSPNLTGSGEPERLTGAAVSAGYFDALGVTPTLGHVFSMDDDRPGAPLAVVLSHRLWTRRFGSDTTLVGRTIQLDGQAATVIGVMPAAFQPPIVPAEIWSAARIDPARAPFGMIMLRVLARRAPGVSLDQAQAALRADMQRLARESGDPDLQDARVALVPLQDDLVGQVRPLLMLLAASVGLVLLIACANVTSVLLARAADRTREMSIRAALGADRRRLLRQLFAESALLAVAGGALGLIASIWGVRTLLAVAPPGLPRLDDVRLDGAVLVFTAATTVITAALAGLAPALAASRVDLASLREGGRESTAGPGRLRSLLVIFEVAAAMVLIVGAALLLRSFVALRHVDLGFRPEGVLTASVAPPRGSYRTEDDVRLFYDRATAAASMLPGVVAASMTSVLPLSGTDVDLSFRIDGRAPTGRQSDEPVAWTRSVGADYFRTMGMRLITGHAFTPQDTQDAPGVALVNETLAKRYWPGESPIGARLNVESRDVTVVGVVADIHHRGPAQPPEGEMYLPYPQSVARQGWLVLRTNGDPASLVAPLRAAVRQIDPNLPAAALTPMSQLAASAVVTPKFLAALLGGFAATAVVLALVGVYGLLSFSVSRRVREIGLRIALGAGRASVVGLVLRQTMAIVGIAIVVGAGLAIALSRLLQALLFGVAPNDPATILAMAGLIVVAALGASYLPARRAASIDPIVALRNE